MMIPSPSLTRKLLKSDLDRVVGIDGALSGRQRRAFYAKKIATVVAGASEATVALVAEREGRIVGFVFAHVLDGEFGGTAPVGVLDAIGVAPAARREGNGATLLAALEEALAGRGVRELRTQAEWSEHELVGFFAAAGFRISPRLVLERPLDRPPEDRQEEEELPVRSMTERDLRAIVQLDRKITGRDRSTYYARKADEVLKDSGIRVSLVAEVDKQFAGFLMARVDFGEYGRTEPTAVLDTIGVAPAFARRHVGRALVEQLLRNLGSLRVERVVTEVEWNHFALLQFLERTGFVPSQRLSFTKSVG